MNGAACLADVGGFDPLLGRHYFTYRADDTG
jgi:hypothetical protein